MADGGGGRFQEEQGLLEAGRRLWKVWSCSEGKSEPRSGSGWTCDKWKKEYDSEEELGFAVLEVWTHLSSCNLRSVGTSVKV